MQCNVKMSRILLLMEIKIEHVYRATPGSLYVSVRSSLLASGPQARPKAVYDTQD